MAGVVRSMCVVEDKGSVAVDRLPNTVPCAPGPGIGVVTTMVAAASRGSERARDGRCCWGEASLLVLCTVDLACEEADLLHQLLILIRHDGLDSRLEIFDG